MSVTAIVGAQWGDEGKGRIIDYLAQEADVVIRFQGGDNAGHTVINEYGKHALHLIPSGIFNPRTQNIIGSGCVVNPESLLKEMESLKPPASICTTCGSARAPRCCCPITASWMCWRNRRGARTPSAPPSAASARPTPTRPARAGLRMGDLLQPEWLETRLDNALRTVNRKIEILGGDPVDGEELYACAWSIGRNWAPHHRHPAHDPPRHPRQKKHILLEGQLGVMRDLDWGIYPYVTSSNPTASYAASGAGLPARTIDRVIGVVKAYSTAVGDGPFPVELHDADGDKLRRSAASLAPRPGARGAAAGSTAWPSAMRPGSTA
jgi:adenylosuccinate synthase